MSKTVLIALILICFFTITGVLFFQTPNPEKKILSGVAPKASPTPVRLPRGIIIDLPYNNQNLRILSVEIPASASMSLVANFSEKQFGENLIEENSCDIAINGGFYKGDHTPLGLFMTEGNLLGQTAKSNVANGFFWQDKSGNRDTSATVPYNLIGLEFILQSGPYFRVRTRGLSLINDARARRSLIGQSSEGQLYFISMITRENNYAGPYLTDLPVIFSQPQVQRELPLTTILNLDGGSASFFFSRDEISTFTLSSISPIGSLLCVKVPMNNPSNYPSSKEVTP